MSFLQSKWAPPLLIAAFVALAYWRVVQCGFIWDDDDYVTQNPVLRSWSGLWQIWFEPTSLPQYYPLVHTTFWLEFQLWGLWAAGYHLVNVVLHAISALLVFRLARRLSLPAALFAALLFAVHPVHVESVAWITERKNVLSLLCYLLAAQRWFAWHDHRGKLDYGIGLLWLLCALWSKTVTASLPAALLVVVWWRDGRISSRAWLGAAPWFAIGALLGWFTVHLEATHVGAADAPWQLAGAERLLVAGRAVWFYAGSLLWPFATCFNYPRWEVDAANLLQWAFPLAAVLAVGGGLLMRHRIGRGPAAALLVFGGTLVPAIGFFDVYPFRYSFVADHFQYHASIALLIGGSALAAHSLHRMPARVRQGLAVLWLLALTYAAQAQVAEYRDYETLWQATLQKNPQSALSLANLGAIATNRGDTEAARDYLQRTLAIDPTSDEALLNLGVLAHREGDRRQARKHYEAALRLKPDEANGRNNLAVLELEEGNTEAALTLVEPAVAGDPSYFDGRVTLGWALTNAKQWQRALEHLDWVLARRPDARESRLRAVLCLLELGQVSRAAGNAMLAVKQRPDDRDALQLLGRAMALALRQAEPGQIRQQAINACKNGGVDPKPVLPAVAAALRQLGATRRAAAITRGP